MTAAEHSNSDPAELQRFEQAAAHWWDPEGEFKPLHILNPLRIEFINKRAPLAGQRVLDVGCGGGLLAEAMADLGADVTGIDLGEQAIAVARLHLLESGQQVDYQFDSAEAFAAQHPAEYDVVTCLEMLEHVPEPASVVSAIGQLVKPGGRVFLSTINRNAKSFAMAIVGAEYLLKLIPAGTHEYRKLIQPAELAHWARSAGLGVDELVGLHYKPLTRHYSFGGNVDVNYFVCCTKQSPI
jgi:2-polyprenyl-6-hydroxyphenyl methylase/3-demethylubiquinone-9 3-methyltransferase